MNAPINSSAAPDLSQLRDIHLPDPVSWWPLAPGWWILLALAILIPLTVYALVKLRKRHRVRHAWRGVAQGELAALRQSLAAKQLTPHQTVAALSVLLRRAAITSLPRDQVAALSGEAWLAFLDQVVGESALFQSPAGRLLAAAPYMPDSAIDAKSIDALFALCETWLSKLGCKPYVAPTASEAQP